MKIEHTTPRRGLFPMTIGWTPVQREPVAITGVVIGPTRDLDQICIHPRPVGGAARMPEPASDPDLDPGYSFVPLAPPPVFAGRTGAQDAVSRVSVRLAEAVEQRRGCIQLTICLDATPSAACDRHSDAEQARMVAKLAQTLTGLARSTCVTPNFTASGMRDQRMRLSLLVDRRSEAEVLDALDLGRRLAAGQGLTLTQNRGRRLDSFPIVGLFRT